MKRAGLIAAMIVCSGQLELSSALGAEGESSTSHGPKSYLRASAADMQWWRDAKFGLFIHWGPVSLKGTEIGWSRGGERRGRKDKSTGRIPVAEYDTLYKRFNPTEFDAAEWVAIAKAAGMKYLVFTTKHHDGFSMFDSKLTDYKITNAPFQRDVTGELSRACHEGGLRLGYYYSPPDWHHPDYRTETHAKYRAYMHGQLRELCTNYGRIDVIWFDGLGGKAEDWGAEDLFRVIRKLQPHVLINNRAGLPADFDTPEQRVGRFQPNRAWESCITICRQWAWKPNDKMKSLKECVDTLVRCVGGDGNLLLNVGPMPTGEIEPRQVMRLKEIGTWLGDTGKAIYGTRGGPFRPGPWGASTHKENRIYLHVLAWPGDTVTLPPLSRKIVAGSVMTGGSAEVTQTDEKIEISVAPSHRQALDTIVVLELDGPIAGVKVGKLATGSVALGKKAAASNVYRGMERYGPDKAFDDDPDTRWATDAGVHHAWLEVDLGAPTKIGRATISEAYDRVRAFELQHKVGDTWRSFARGTRIGASLALPFEPVTARFVRLNISKATEGPTIWEFHLLSGSQ